MCAATRAMGRSVRLEGALERASRGCVGASPHWGPGVNEGPFVMLAALTKSYHHS